MELTKNENLIKLIKILNDNPDKAKEFYNMGDWKELYEYSISLVPGYDFDEFIKFMESIAKGSMSDDELSKISGGLDFSETCGLATNFIKNLISSKQTTDEIIKKLTDDKDEDKEKGKRQNYTS